MRNHQYIKTLDGWRAIAIIAVILTHINKVAVSPGSLLFKILENGKDGVPLFFAISGYIISVKIFSELDITGSINFRAFYTRRIFRLVPATLVFLLFLVVLNIVGYIQINPGEIWSTLFFWRNYFDVNGDHPLTIHFWSLSVEEHFYLFFPAFLLFLKTSKKIFWGIIILGLWVTFWRKIGTMDSITNVIPFTKYTMFYTMGRLDGLLYGALLALIQRSFKDLSNGLSKIPPLVPIVLLILLFAFPFPLTVTWKALLFPLLIYSTMSHEESLISKFLELKPVIFIGQISYSLYIWHPLFVSKNNLAPRWLQTFTGGWGAILPVFIISYLSYRYLETPLRKIGVILSRKLEGTKLKTR